jgi:hypothetical protein
MYVYKISEVPLLSGARRTFWQSQETLQQVRTHLVSTTQASRSQTPHGYP